MAVEIRATNVTHDADGDVVQLHISDAPLEDASASLLIVLTAKLRPMEAPALGHVQRETLILASQSIRDLINDLERVLKHQNYPLEPRPGKSRF